MAIAYFDSSAYVKLVVDEPGSDLAAALWDGCDTAVASRLAYPEVRAALAAAARGRRLSSADLRRAESGWEEYWAATRPVEMTAVVSAQAGEMAAAHGLRGADAVHLASALAVGPAFLLFAVWDQRLRAGARAVGIQTVPS